MQKKQSKIFIMTKASTFERHISFILVQKKANF